MNKRRVQLFLAILICISTVSAYGAFDEQIKFKMTVSPGAGYTVLDDEVLLSIGSLVTVDVWAWVDSEFGTTGNGLDTWQMDLGVNTSGIIGITKTGEEDETANISRIAPNPDLSYRGWDSVNTPVTGEIKEVSVTQLVPGASSGTGIGGYSEIFSFQIEGLAEGIATYTIEDDGGGLFAFLVGDEWFEDDISADGGVYFDALGSDNVFHVTPEPCSLMILSGLSLIGLRRRRRLG